MKIPEVGVSLVILAAEPLELLPQPLSLLVILGEVVRPLEIADGLTQPLGRRVGVTDRHGGGSARAACPRR